MKLKVLILSQFNLYKPPKSIMQSKNMHSNKDLFGTAACYPHTLQKCNFFLLVKILTERLKLWIPRGFCYIVKQWVLAALRRITKTERAPCQTALLFVCPPVTLSSLHRYWLRKLQLF